MYVKLIWNFFAVPGQPSEQKAVLHGGAIPGSPGFPESLGHLKQLVFSFVATVAGRKFCLTSVEVNWNNREEFATLAVIGLVSSSKFSWPISVNLHEGKYYQQIA